MITFFWIIGIYIASIFITYPIIKAEMNRLDAIESEYPIDSGYLSWLLSSIPIINLIAFGQALIVKLKLKE